MSHRVAIIGSRSFRALHLVCAAMDALPAGVAVVTGDVPGVDTRVIECCVRRGLEHEVVAVDGLDPDAVERQKKAIVDRSERLVAFWDGSSFATGLAIELARAAGVPVEVVPDEPDPGARPRPRARVGSTRWEPLPAGLEAQQRHLERELAAWDGTPYWPGQQSRGPRGGVDCVRFVAAVLDAVRGTRTPIETLPPDASMHASDTAKVAMLRIRRAFEPSDFVIDGTLQPGDVVVTGPIGGGPGHAMIVGCQRNVLWESNGTSVRRVGLGALERSGHQVFYVFRLGGRESWRTS